MDPAQDVGHSRLRAHVGNRIAHAEVGADRAVEGLIKNAEHISRRPADIHADDVDILSLGDGLKDIADRAGCGHDRRIGPTHEFVVARRVGHDVFEEHVVNGVAGRPKVLSFERGTKILNDGQINTLIECLGHQRRSILVAGEDQRERKLASKPRLRLGRGDQLGDLHNLHRVAAIGSAREENHVRAQLTDALNLFVRPTFVIGGDDIHHNRPSAECCTLGAGRGHLRHNARHHHLQTTASRRRRDIQIATLRLRRGLNDSPLIIDEPSIRQLRHFGDGVDHAHRDVGERFLDGRGRFAAVRLAILTVNTLDQNRFGGGAPTVGGEDHVHLIRINLRHGAADGP